MDEMDNWRKDNWIWVRCLIHKPHAKINLHGVGSKLHSKHIIKKLLIHDYYKLNHPRSRKFKAIWDNEPMVFRG